MRFFACSNSYERFLKLSAEYEAEQKELTEFVQSEQTAVNSYEQDKADFDSFVAVIHKYVGIRELTPTIVNEFVKKTTPPTNPTDTADKRWKLFGTSSEVLIRQRRNKQLNGKEKARRHNLLTGVQPG